MRTVFGVALLVLASCVLAHAQLSQTALYPNGLGGDLDLGPVLPAAGSTYVSGASTAGCNNQECNGATMTAWTGNFDDSTHTVLICVCEGAQMDTNSLTYGMSQVPLFMRQNVNVITSIPDANAHAYTAGGDITLFGFVQFDVFIHESAHAQDNGFSSSDAFKTALASDTCVPDEYARTNEVECYAQDMVVFLYELWKGSAPAPGTACMSNQLQALHNSDAPGLQDYISTTPYG